MALVAGVGGWVFRPTSILERVLLIIAAGFLFYTGPLQDVIGVAFFAAAIELHWFRVKDLPDDSEPTPAVVT